MRFKQVLNSGLTLALITQLVACQVVNNEPINNHYKTINNLIQEDQTASEFNQNMAEELEKLASNLESSANQTPQWEKGKAAFHNERSHFDRISNGRDVFERGLSAKERFRKNRENVNEWYQKLEGKGLKIQGFIKSLGKDKYKKDETKKLVRTPEQMAKNEVLVLYALSYLRQTYYQSAGQMYRYMTKFTNPDYENLEGYNEFRKDLLKKFMTLVGMTKVVDQDMSKTLKGLKIHRKQGNLQEGYSEKIGALIGTFQKEMAPSINKFQNVINSGMTKKAQSKFQEAITKFNEKFENKSLLYNPNNPDHPLIHIAVVASNLTWGLINSLVGLGFVLTAAILAPTTYVIRKVIRMSGHYPAVAQVHFPKLRVSDSNMQIYADVCGLGIVPGKMSAGLFELDFCAGQSFASHHEAGHAKQSALLGPLYFPAAILSYAMVGGHGGFIESWATNWQTSGRWDVTYNHFN